MCAILDANVAGEMFGNEQTEAGSKFRDWIDDKSGRLVLGGHLRNELYYETSVRKWINELQSAGRIRNVSDVKVNARAEVIRKTKAHKSNDPHILALAQVSGARLLYTNDRDLQADFKDSKLINHPRGKVYTTRKFKRFGRSHRNLLRRNDLCSKH